MAETAAQKLQRARRFSKQVEKSFSEKEEKEKVSRLKRTRDIAEGQGKTETVRQTSRRLEDLGVRTTEQKTTVKSAAPEHKKDVPMLESFLPENQQKKSFLIPAEQRVKTIGGVRKVDTRGVIGIEDPITKTSFATAPISEAEVRRLERERFAKIDAERQAQRTAQIRAQRAADKPKPIDTRGVVRASTEKEKKAMRQEQNPISQFIEGIKGGVFFRETTPRGSTLRPTGTLSERARGAGAGIGNVLGIAAISQADKPIRLQSGAVAAIEGTKIAAGIRALPLGNLALGTAATVAAGQEGRILGTELTLQRQATTKEERKLIKEFSGVTSKAIRAEDRALGQTGPSVLGRKVSLRSIGTNLGFESFGDEKAFRQSVRAQLKDRGVSPGKIERTVDALSKERKARFSGLLGSGLTTAASSERIGREGVSRLAETGLTLPAKNPGTALFKALFKPIAEAGVGEGISQEISRQQVFETDIGVFERRKTRAFGFDLPGFTRAEKALGAGVIGGVSAGTIGGLIGATRIKSPGTSKAIETATFILDPLEKPGDILQDITEVASRGAVPIRPSPVVTTPVGVPSETFTFTTETKVDKKKLPQDVTPEQFADFLEGQGKLKVKKDANMFDFDYSKFQGPIPKDNRILGQFQYDPTGRNTPRILVRGDLEGKVRQHVFKHELTHFLNPKRSETTTELLSIFGPGFKTPGTITAVPTITEVPTPVGISATTQTQVKRKAAARNKAPVFQIGTPTPISLGIPQFTPVSTPTPVSVPTTIQNIVGTTSTPTPVPTPTPVSVPTDVPVDIPIGTPVTTQTPVNVPVDIPAEVPVNVPVDTPVNVPINVPIPVTTPINRAGMPFFPVLDFPGGGRGTGSGRRRRKKFVDELAFAGTTLTSAIGFTPTKPGSGKGFTPDIFGFGFSQAKPKPKPKKKAKGKKKKKKTSRSRRLTPEEFLNRII